MSTFAEQVVAAVFAVVDRQKLNGHPNALSRSTLTPLMVSEVAKLDADRTAPQTNGKAVPGPFGDRKHIPPLPEWVTAYSLSIGYPMDGAKWCDSYGQKGWMVGKTKMKDWQCAVRNWKSSKWGQCGIALVGVGQSPTDYKKF